MCPVVIESLSAPALPLAVRQVQDVERRFELRASPPIAMQILRSHVHLGMAEAACEAKLVASDCGSQAFIGRVSGGNYAWS